MYSICLQLLLPNAEIFHMITPVFNCIFIHYLFIEHVVVMLYIYMGVHRRSYSCPAYNYIIVCYKTSYYMFIYCLYIINRGTKS